jgi:flagellar hook assembly protein FlgD
VRTLFAGSRAAGWHDATWDGSDANGSRVASGVYFLRLTSANESQVQRFVIVR